MGTVSEKLPVPPHAVCIPFPAQGHINPMFNLAKLLHQNGIHITFVNTEYNHNRLLESGGPHSLDGLSTFRFETIPDGLPPSVKDMSSLCYSTSKNCLAPFRDLLARLNDTSSEVPPVSCIVSDGVMSFTIEAAKELGVPNFLFWVISACGFWGNFHFRQLVEKGFMPVIKDESYLTNGYLETVVDWIPGMEGISYKHLQCFPKTKNSSSLFGATDTDPDDIVVNLSIKHVENARNASGIIINTFDELEHETLQHLSQLLPPIYTVGPLHMFQNHIQDKRLSSLGSSLWKEQPSCIEWLESKEPESVLYVNFGSLTVLNSNQLVQLAWGLANSKVHFLWVIRPDLVAGESAVVPPEFVAEIEERGLLASWCPQEEVLRHPCVGGFLTHSGWNSTMESLSNGVPMICCPFYAEQPTNCWFTCNKWGVGMEMDSDVKSEEIESLVRELMEGEKGKGMKKKAKEWKMKAVEAVSSGSSLSSLNKMMNRVGANATFEQV